MGGTLTREATLSNGVSLPKCVALGLRLLTQEMGLPPPPLSMRLPTLCLNSSGRVLTSGPT